MLRFSNSVIAHRSTHFSVFLPPTRRSFAVTSSIKNYKMSSNSFNLLVVSSKDGPELEVLKRLPLNVNIVGIGRNFNELSHLTEDDWKNVTVLLNCGVGARAATRADIQEMWSKLVNLEWMHSASAGLEHLLFPELVNGPVTLTNAKGVYSHSLAEFALSGCSWFAKDFPRLLRAKALKNWDPFEVEELRGRTMGIIGFGDIGRACARLARAYRMKVVGLRRRTALSESETREGLVDRMYGNDELSDLMSSSDYVVVALPYTPMTDKFVDRAAINSMRANAVFVNVGRGKTVDEAALIDALVEKRIRGAALDVFATEPLPSDSPLWSLPNVFMSPHCADKTREFQFESLEFFIENVSRFLDKRPLLNVCDKNVGY